jgi:hypothetical protein
MAAHKGPDSSRPRCTRGGSPVAAIPIYHLPYILQSYTMYKPAVKARNLQKKTRLEATTIRT